MVPGLDARKRSTAAMCLRMVQANPRPIEGQGGRVRDGLATGVGEGPVGAPAGCVAAAAGCWAACDFEHAASAWVPSSAAAASAQARREERAGHRAPEYEGRGRRGPRPREFIVSGAAIPLHNGCASASPPRDLSLALARRPGPALAAMIRPPLSAAPGPRAQARAAAISCSRPAESLPRGRRRTCSGRSPTAQVRRRSPCRCGTARR